jgi:hypothetical protein
MVCTIPDCPALVREGSTRCPLHAVAALAKHVGGVARTASGRGGSRCLACRRVIREDDWIWREPDDVGPPPRYRHVACAPPVPRETRARKIASPKPLLQE